VLEKLSMKYDEFGESKPSSVTTAMTKATTVYDYRESKKDSRKDAQKKEAKKHSSKSGLTGEKLLQVGQKRQSQLKLDEMEMFTRMFSKSSSSGTGCKALRLKDKKTGEMFTFSLFD